MKANRNSCLQDTYLQEAWPYFCLMGEESQAGGPRLALCKGGDRTRKPCRLIYRCVPQRPPRMYPYRTISPLCSASPTFSQSGEASGKIAPVRGLKSCLLSAYHNAVGPSVDLNEHCRRSRRCPFRFRFRIRPGSPTARPLPSSPPSVASQDVMDTAIPLLDIAGHKRPHPEP